MSLFLRLPIVSTIIIALSLIILTGCAATREVYLTNGQAPASPAISKKREICFSGFSDSRKDSTIGTIFGYKSVRVRAANNVKDWVNNEMSNELKSAGYSVNANCSDRDHSIQLIGEIVRVYVAADSTCEDSFVLETRILAGSRRIYKRTYTEYKNGGPYVDATYLAGSLESSLNAAVANVIADIDAIDGIMGELSETDSVPQIATAAVISHSLDFSPDSAWNGFGSSCLEVQGDITTVKGNRGFSTLLPVLDTIKEAVLSTFNNIDLDIKPGFSGDLNVRFTIAPDGTTNHYRIVWNSLYNKQLQDQLSASIRSAHFKAISSDSVPSIVSYEMKFKAEAIGEPAPKGGRHKNLPVAVQLLLILSLGIFTTLLYHYTTSLWSNSGT
jgi:hypothetical protein